MNNFLNQFLNQFPYSDFHEMNLSWIVDIVKKLGVNTEELSRQLDEFKDDTEAQLKYLTDWVNNYNDSFMRDEIAKYIATMIFPEITDSGYIVYYIPETWDDVTFNTTDLDISVPGVDYGHLVLSY